jgi:hypothetical protein
VDLETQALAPNMGANAETGNYPHNIITAVLLLAGNDGPRDIAVELPLCEDHAKDDSWLSRYRIRMDRTELRLAKWANLLEM